MNIEDFLKQAVRQAGRYQLSPVDEKLIRNQGVEEFIFQKLTSKKFRKWSLKKDDAKRIRDIIHQRLESNKPLLFTFPFGGYKLWRLPTAPEADWAEVFATIHYLNHIAPVAAAYEPGVQFYFSSDEVIIERMDNIPQKDTQAYTQSLKKVLQAFQNNLPDNIDIKLQLVRDLYTKEEFELELAENLKAAKKKWDQEEDQTKKDRYFEMSKLNIKMDGVKDWTTLSEEEQREKIWMGPIYHDAYVALKKRAEFVKGPDKIIIFSFPIRGIPCIPVGTTKASVTKFWTGTGMLERRDGTFKELVLSPAQLEAVADKEIEEKAVDLFSENKNLQTINVIQNAPNFSAQ